MTKRLNTRLKDVEKRVQPPERRKVVVDWDPEPGPEESGVTYVYWDDDDIDAENDDDG